MMVSVGVGVELDYPGRWRRVEVAGGAWSLGWITSS